MKIRNGFVSNSSSSSFVIRVDENFPTVKSVAKYIISKFENLGYDYQDEKELLEKMPDDTPVEIDSGDDTYIRKFGDKIVIKTTQNVSFDELNSISIRELSEEFKKQFEYYNEDDEYHTIEYMEDFDYYYKKFDDFLMLRYGIYAKKDYMDDCPYCNSNFSRCFILPDNRKICECQIDKESLKIQRSQKIKNINVSLL